MSEEVSEEKELGPEELPEVPEEPEQSEQDVRSDVTDEKQPFVQTEPLKYDDLVERSKIDVNLVSEALDRAEEPKPPLLKRDYIRNIKKLTSKFSDRILSRMKKDDLKRLLAEQWERNVEEIGSVHSEPQEVPRINNEALVRTLYSCTLVCASGIEALTKNFSCYLGGYCLDGYARALDAQPNRDQLIQILSEISIQNAELIQEYCSVENRLALIFILSAVNSVKHISQANESHSKV